MLYRTNYVSYSTSPPGLAAVTLTGHINFNSQTAGRGNTAFRKLSSPITTARNRILN